MGLSPFLRSEILLIKFRVFEFVVLIDPVRGRSWKSVSSRTRYPHFLLSDQRSAISQKTEKPVLDGPKDLLGFLILRRWRKERRGKHGSPSLRANTRVLREFVQRKRGFVPRPMKPSSFSTLQHRSSARRDDWNRSPRSRPPRARVSKLR